MPAYHNRTLVPSRDSMYEEFGIDSFVSEEEKPVVNRHCVCNECLNFDGICFANDKRKSVIPGRPRECADFVDILDDTPNSKHLEG